MRRIMALLLLLIPLAAIRPGRTSARGAELYAAVEARPGAPQAGDRPSVEVTLTPAEGVQLYREHTAIELAPAGGLRLGEFTLPPGKVKLDEASGEKKEVYLGPTTIRLPVIVPAGEPAGRRELKLTVNYLGCKGQVCFMPQSQTISLPLEIPGPRPQPPVPESPPATGTAAPPGREPGSPAPADPGEGWIRQTVAGGGLLAILAAFLAGLAVSFTPCVYPMVPITVALIGSAAAGRDGAKRRSVLLPFTLIYVLGISLTYAVLGVLAASVGNVMQQIMQTWWLLAVVGAVMGLLALSMFGAFELQLPASIIGRLGRFQGGGSLPMLLFSGVVLGLVASPCVSGPIAFLLLAIGRSRSVLFGGAGMFAFAWGMSALLIVAGLFPGFLGRPGPWMLKVKAAFGVVMALAGLYFLRTVVPVWVFSLAATLVALGLGLALLAASRRLAETGAGRRWAVAAGGLLLVVGGYLAFGTAVRSGAMVALAQSTLPVGVAAQMCPRDRADPVHVDWQPYGPEALRTALASGKPAMVDFYADWCSNCLHMEQEVFTDRRVVAELERFVRLRVDGSTGAPKEPVREAEGRFSIAGYPTIVIFGSDGREAERIVGAVSAEYLLAKLRAVR